MCFCAGAGVYHSVGGSRCCAMFVCVGIAGSVGDSCVLRRYASDMRSMLPFCIPFSSTLSTHRRRLVYIYPYMYPSFVPLLLLSDDRCRFWSSSSCGYLRIAEHCFVHGGMAGIHYIVRRVCVRGRPFSVSWCVCGRSFVRAIGLLSVCANRVCIYVLSLSLSFFFSTHFNTSQTTIYHFT